MTQTISTWSELLALDLTGNHLWITGSPASGKTFCANALRASNPFHALIHTDDYISDNFVEGMYTCLLEVQRMMELPAKLIVEGVYIPRMLRKAIEYGQQLPDMVLILEISEQRFIQTYHQERDMTKLRGAMALFKGSSKIMEDLSEILPSSVEIINFKNNY